MPEGGVTVSTAQVPRIAAPAPVPVPYHLHPDAPRPTRPVAPAKWLYQANRILAPNRAWYRLALWLEANRWAYRAFTRLEALAKGRLFACRMCGQCALPTTGYACPMSCPKQLRNGPCGGVSMEGHCEVYPGLPCVWLVAYERAEREGRAADLRRLQRPVDYRRWGQSAWVNYWLGRDEQLWTTTHPELDIPLLSPRQASAGEAPLQPA